jgi:dTDP-4-amino-4,6-dideoxygalactose transaminase
MLGTIGDVGCMSVMSGKSLAIGEGGLLVTDDRLIHERAVAFGFYGRARGSTWGSGEAEVTAPELTRFSGVPLGGVKHRLNQTAAAMGRVQLRHYPERLAEIQRAMNHFWDLLEDVPGVRAHRVAPDSGSTMGGWYIPVGRYIPEELGGLAMDRFLAAASAEGCPVGSAPNYPLHLHPFFHEADVYGDGKPTSCAFADRDVRQGPGSLPVAERFERTAFRAPWFKHYRPGVIAQYADAVRKVCENAASLLEDDARAASVAD